MEEFSDVARSAREVKEDAKGVSKDKGGSSSREELLREVEERDAAVLYAKLEILFSEFEELLGEPSAFIDNGAPTVH